MSEPNHLYHQALSSNRKLLAENTRLKAELTDCKAEADRLKAEVELMQAEWNPVLQVGKGISLSKENARLKAEVERLTAWQPIETLPMFQEGLVVCEGLSGIYFATRYKSGVESSMVDVEEYKPTHWMPLPNPPAAKEGKPSV